MAAQKNNAPKEYGADSITILEGLEAVRKRPGMYIGSTGERGLHHLIWEVVDNAVDEAMAGFATRVDVKIHADGSVEVKDDGRGIPVEMHATGMPTIDVVMTQLHAGGKFDGETYAVSGGLHGVGVSVVNALSTRLEATVLRDGHEWFQYYDRSVPGELKQGAPTKETGTTIRFWADPEIFETTDYNFETVARRLQEMAFLNKGLTIELTDERVSAEEVVDDVVSDTADAPKTADEKAAEASAPNKVKHRVFHYPGGLVDYVKHINRTKTPIQQSIIDFAGKGPGHEVEIAMQWNAGYSESVHTFANTINTHEGGTHEEGFR
ncbi:DNA topoisomerase IV subunit B, partial [Mycolicibacterium goodii]